MIPSVANWPHLTVISVIDILIVAVIIYEFLALIRGTRAALILVGVSVVILAFYFARVGQLVTLYWLISRVLPYRPGTISATRGCFAWCVGSW